MKKIITFLIIFLLSCNLVFAEVAFYEDFTFYGELITDINLSEANRTQKIQLVLPSPYNKRIPMILNGQAKLKKIDGKSMIYLNFNELSLDARKHIPVEILTTAVNSKKLKQACYPNKNKYTTGLKNATNSAKEFALFPLNSFNATPKVAKPSKNNFIMLLEPFYACGGLALFAFSPIAAPFCVGDNFCDIQRGAIIEFQFLKQMTKEELKKVLGQEYF